jgi:protoporphyrinogen oxidase
VSLPAGYRESLLRIQYLGAISLVFASPQSLSPFYWTNIHSEESPFIVCIQHTNLMDPAAYGGEHMYYLGDYLPHDHHLFALSDEQVMQEFFSSLKKIFPEFREEQVTEKHVFRSPYAQHVAEVEYPKIVPGHRTPLPHVYLANFGQVFPEDRGIGAAVRDGKAVARMMLEDP